MNQEAQISESDCLQVVNQNGLYTAHLTKKGKAIWMTRISLISQILCPVVVILPKLFLDCGIGTSISILAAIGALLWITCQFCAQITVKGIEIEFAQVVSTNLGTKWCKLYQVIEIQLLLQVAVLYFILSSEFIFPVIQFIWSDKLVADREQFTFQMFSYQLTGIILALVVLFTLLINKLNLILMKLTRLKTFSLFLLSILCLSIAISRVSLFEYQQINSDDQSSSIILLIGSCIMLFQVHSQQVPILLDSSTKAPQRDITFSFCINLIILTLLSVSGAIIAADDYKISAIRTILDCFGINELFANIVRGFLFISTFSLSGVISKSFRGKLIDQIQQLFPEKGTQYKKLITITISIIIPIIILLFQLFEVDLQLLAAITGYVCCAPISIIIPFCLYMSPQNQNLQQQQQQQLSETDIRRIMTTASTNGNIKDILSIGNQETEIQVKIQDQFDSVTQIPNDNVIDLPIMSPEQQGSQNIYNNNSNLHHKSSGNNSNNSNHKNNNNNNNKASLFKQSSFKERQKKAQSLHQQKEDLEVMAPGTYQSTQDLN